MKLFTKRLRSTDRGQAILLIALAMLVLAAFVGLMTDVGVMFIEYGKLKRGIDSGAIAAAQQFRNGFDPADLTAAARNFLTLNQTTANNITLFRCKDDPTDPDGTMHDETLCSTPRRKLIRVEAERTVNFGFLRVVGINGTTIRASSVGEAASIDLVLVIDTSASMSFETGGDPNYADNPADDPAFCNNPANATPCQPLTAIKNVAVDFVSNSNALFFPYDRVSIVTMTSQIPGGPRDHETVLMLSDDQTEIVNAINNLKVFEPVACDWGNPASPEFGTCRNYGDASGPGLFLGMGCPIRSRGADLLDNTADDNDLIPDDPTTCGSSNIGGALFRASGEFVRDGIRRDEALWVVILLAGGPANATDTPEGHNPLDPGDPLRFGYCPSTTWDGVTNPFCRDASAATRHSITDADTSDDTLYDADDYARDQADFLADPVDGQGITMFTIGLGRLIRNASLGDADAGEKLLQYVAQQAGDDKASPPSYTANHGTYSYTPDTAGLAAIFDAIAENIFTRIAQ